MDFDQLLSAHKFAVERYVRFRLPSPADAEDVLQEVYVTALRSFHQLKHEDAFKAWLVGIARNKCADWFRQQYRRQEVPLEAAANRALQPGRMGLSAPTLVTDTLCSLSERDQQILELVYWENLPQQEIARQLHLPLGTVKSRLHTAKQNFRRMYPHPTPQGGTSMKKLPATMPAYTIKPLNESPFPVKWEELMGWFHVPRLGEKLQWAMYDQPSGRCTQVFDIKTIGQAEVHGIRGVEIVSRETPFGKPEEAVERTFVAQLTDTHCRYLSCSFVKDGVRRYYTFLDGDSFLSNWGFGEDNCGNETNLSSKGDIIRQGSIVTSANKEFLLDIVGRYAVTINGKTWDAVCVMDIETYDSGMVTEQYLDKNGRTVLWRRFNPDDWNFSRYQQHWSEMLPDSERITVNGKPCVHWYDCITEYVL